MIGCSWNYQSIRASLTVHSLRDLCVRSKPNIVFFMETKAKKKKIFNLQRRLKFDDAFVVDAHGNYGGFCNMWRKEYIVEVL